MKHTVPELLEIVYTYYPRGVQMDDPAYDGSPEHQRLVAARRDAGRDKERWNTLLDGLAHQWPGASVLNQSLHLAGGNFDAGYMAEVTSSEATIGFVVSFLAPYYAVFTSRQELIPTPRSTPPGRAPEHERGLGALISLVGMIITRRRIPGICAWRPSWPSRRSAKGTVSPEMQKARSFDFTQKEADDAGRVARAIESIWADFEPLPPDVGRILVPDVSTNLRMLGAATLFDCLMTDHL